MGILQSSIFNRTQSQGAVVSAATYNLVIGMVLCWGFIMNWVIVRNVDPAWVARINPWIFFISYFVSCIIGAILFNSSSEPAISFIGYNLVVIPFGFVLNVIIGQYEPDLVAQAIQITAAVTLIMMILGILFPAFFKSIAGALFIALLSVIVIEGVQIFFFHIHSDWLDWAVVLIFCGYIGFDWGRANQIPKTIDNAVDSAAAIYMDIINLFVRILRILGRRRR